VVWEDGVVGPGLLSQILILYGVARRERVYIV
jgi:hypothetical protein